jgi:pyruvate dehydrogenase E1 component beta subunit
VTVVAIGSMVPLAVQVAEDLVAEGVEVEVIDLRSLAPWDKPLVLTSVGRTGRLVTVHEAWTAGGVGAEIVASVAECGPGLLRAPVVRVGAEPVPIPSGTLRQYALPSLSSIRRAVLQVVNGSTPTNLSNP